VTEVPNGSIFNHIGKLQFIDVSGFLHQGSDSMSERDLDRTSAGMTGLDLTGWNSESWDAEPTRSVPPIIADHAPVNYALRIWNSYEASHNA
jgi:hypothetical protein